MSRCSSEGLVKANALLAEALCHCHIHVSPCPLQNTGNSLFGLMTPQIHLLNFAGWNYMGRPPTWTFGRLQKSKLPKAVRLYFNGIRVNWEVFKPLLVRGDATQCKGDCGIHQAVHGCRHRLKSLGQRIPTQTWTLRMLGVLLEQSKAG